MASSTRSWQLSDFLGGKLPTSLEGTYVRINGKNGFVAYLSPNQVNLLAPDDDTEGPVQVQVVTPWGSSDAVTVEKRRLAPALFVFGGGTSNYVVALHADGTRVGDPGLHPGQTGRPAMAGDAVSLFGAGFGATDPPHPASDLLVGPLPLAVPVTVRIGASPAEVAYAGLIMPGTYQFNVVIPDVGDGDQPVEIQAGGTIAPERALIPVKRAASSASSRPIIIDHATTDLSRIPDYWIETIKQNIKVYYGHTSHGAQITSGLSRLESQYGSKYSVAIGSTLSPKTGTLRILDAGGAYDWDPDFYPTVPRILADNPTINVVMYMWCGQHATPRWQSALNQYLSDMESLERRYPNVTFVYMSGNAQEKDCTGCVRKQFNEQLKQTVTNKTKVLFDFGDLDIWYNGDVKTYACPIWCSTYGCAAGNPIPYEHPQWGGGDYNNPCGHATYASCDNKARAMWWLLARIAGWDGVSSGPPAGSR